MKDSFLTIAGWVLIGLEFAAYTWFLLLYHRPRSSRAPRGYGAVARWLRYNGFR